MWSGFKKSVRVIARHSTPGDWILKGASCTTSSPIHSTQIWRSLGRAGRHAPMTLKDVNGIRLFSAAEEAVSCWKSCSGIPRATVLILVKSRETMYWKHKDNARVRYALHTHEKCLGGYNSFLQVLKPHDYSTYKSDVSHGIGEMNHLQHSQICSRALTWVA